MYFVKCWVHCTFKIQSSCLFGLFLLFVCFCCCLVFKLCLTLCQSMDCSTSGSSVLPYLPELAQIHDHFVSDTIWTSHLLLLLSPSIFPGIRVFSKELDVQIRWPKYWSFSLSNKLSSEFSWFISFRIDWFEVLAIQRTLKSLLQHHNSKASIFQHSLFFMVQLLHPYMTTGKTIALTMQIFFKKWCHCFLIRFPPKKQASLFQGCNYNQVISGKENLSPLLLFLFYLPWRDWMPWS